MLANTGGSHLSQIFGEHENLSSLWVIQLIGTIYKEKEKKTILAKIQAKWESSLTIVWLKWDPVTLSNWLEGEDSYI